MTGSKSQAIAVGLVVMLILPAGLSMPGLAAATPSSSDVVSAQETPANDTTVPHERPDNVSKAGDSEQVRQWLEGRLVRDLEQSAVEISQSEYERGQDVLDEDTQARLDQYVDAAGETDSNTDDETATTVRETREQQLEYAETVQSYNETYTAYQEARASGNETAARTYARELENQTDWLTRLNESLAGQYDSIANTTGRNTTGAINALSTQTNEIRAQQEAVRAQTLIEIRLRVSFNQSTVAFTNPATLTGQLAMDNGTALANRTVTLVLYEQRETVQTDRDGQFTLTYRPISLPVNVTGVPVQYVPRADSPFLGADATAPVTVQQVTPNLTTDVTASQTRYNQPVRATVVATVNGTPVQSLPLTASLGDVQTQNTTSDNGQTTLTQRVPATVDSGSTQLRITHPRDGLAIGPGTDTTTLTIAPTETELTLESNTNTADQSYTLRGRLTTDGGIAIANQPVLITVRNTTQTVRTSQNGTYRLSLSALPTISDENTTTVSVSAQFDGSGTSLNESQANTTIQITPSSVNGETNGVVSGANRSMMIGAGSTLILILLLAAGALRRYQTAEGPTNAPSQPSQPTQDTPEEPIQQPAQQLLQRAQTSLANDESVAATAAAYAAVRTQVARQVESVESLTHQEFIAACQQNGTTIDTATLATLAENYEQVTFAGKAAPSHARAAVTAASALLSDTDS